MSNIITSIIQVISWGYVVVQLKERKINIKNIKSIFFVIIMILGVFIPLNLKVGFSKTIISYSIFTICFKYIYNISFQESSMLNFMGIVMHFVGELLVTLIIVLLKIDIAVLEKYMYLNPVSGLSVFLAIILIFLLFKQKLIKFYNYLINQNNSNIFYIIIILCFSILFSINISTWQDKDMISNILTIIMFGLVVIFWAIEKIKAIKANNDFNQLFEQSQSISTLLAKYRKMNHENKNDLRVIKGMTKNNKDVQEYIKEIFLEKNIIDNDKWITEVAKINHTGLIGFLSIKINSMVNNNIRVIVNISSRIKDFNFKELDIKEYKDLCRILGVYLDNAYEASKSSESKEVTIEMNMVDNNMEIIISNTFSGEVAIKDLGKYGYTTKGAGHGTGLSLVKDIVSKNKFITQKTSIINNFFYQCLNLEGHNKKDILD